MIGSPLWSLPDFHVRLRIDAMRPPCVGAVLFEPFRGMSHTVPIVKICAASYKAAIWLKRSIAALSDMAAAKRRARSASSRKRSASVVADVFGFEAIIDRSTRHEGTAHPLPNSLSPREDASSIKLVLHFIG